MGASNELPESEELDALYDRFLIRRQVGQVSQAGLLEMLANGGGRKQVGGRVLGGWVDRCSGWWMVGCILGGQAGGDEQLCCAVVMHARLAGHGSCCERSAQRHA